MRVFLYLSLIFLSAAPSKLETLYNSMDPLSVSQHVAFYSLYPDNPSGEKALDHALALLSKETGGEGSPSSLPFFPQGVEAIVSLVTKPEGDEVSPLSDEQWACIQTLSRGLPHQQLRGHEAKSEKEVIGLKPDEIDLAHGWMLSQFPGDDPESIQRRRSYEALLDLMALQILARVSFDASPVEKIHAINQFVFDEMGFRFPPQSQFAKDIDQYTFLSSVLDSRQGVCLGVSILYICLAQRLGLELEMVTPPGHIYVRYNGPNELINIETTARGIHLDNEMYLSVDTCALQERNTKEMIGLAHFNQAGVYLQRGDYAQALQSYERALPYLPDDLLMKELMGYQLLFVGRTNEGKELLQQVQQGESPFTVSKERISEDFLSGAVNAAGIQPIFSHVDQKRSSILKKKEEVEAVLHDYPRFRAGLFQLGVSWLQLHRDREAYEVLQQYHSLDPDNASVEYYLAILAWKRKEYEKAWGFLDRAIACTEKKGHHPKALRDLRKEFVVACPRRIEKKGDF